MGLDITAYEMVADNAYAPLEFEKECDWEDTVLIYNIPEFAARQDGLADGRYKVGGRVFEFRAGSYSGYNGFRDRLAEMLDYAGAKEVWERVDNGDKGLLEAPFVKLIHYADNEGTLGPKTCLGLARDFRDWLPYAERHLDQYDLDTYRHFLVAFELAAGKGVVCFG